MKQKIKETLTLLRTETFLKRDILRALRAATTKFADNVTEEKAIAEALYKKMVKKGG